MTHQGTISLDVLSEMVAADKIDTVVVAFTDLYGRLLGKRFAADFFLRSVAQNGTHACDYLLTVDMEMEPIEGYEFANWEKGYGDVHLVPDMKTLRVASWLDRTAIVTCDIHDQATHVALPLAPRSLLQAQTARAAEKGWDVMAASELEYYLFRDSYRAAMEKGYRDLQSAGWYIEDYHTLQGTRVEDFNATARRALSTSGVPVESTKGEWGLGQHEINVQYAEITEMADRHVLIKQCLKEIAERQGLSTTFMAKFDEQQAGSSCHVHMSLWWSGQNAFRGTDPIATLTSSPTFRYFAGGWLARLPELMVLLAPTVNSYKRFRSASWAPTRLAWSLDNRTAAVRVVGREASLRLECRLPGADCNPYLAYAALLAAGLDGIENQTEPPELFFGDVYANDNIPRVPTSLAAAIDQFDQSEFARSVFGDKVVEHYVHFYRVEQHLYDRAVTDWERARYFERI